MGAHFAHLFLCRVGGLCCCDLFICSLSVNKHRQCTVGWLTCMVLGAKQEFFSLYFAPLFHILKNWYHTIGVHFYGEVDRGMLNVEGSRKETTYRTCVNCVLVVIATEGLAVRKSGQEKSSSRSEDLILITREKWHFEEES